jgi:hypothetical protein
MTNSTYARIDHNEIGPKAHTGNPLSIFGEGGLVATHTRIDHNYIHDIETGGPYPTMGCGYNPGGEAIRVGVSSLATLSSFTIIESNVFERCDGDPETISTKTSDNVIRYNTFRSNAGTISLRAGDRARVCGNVMLGASKVCSGGIRMCGNGHSVYDNYVEGVLGYTMELHAGDATHAPVVDAKVLFNTLLGEGKGAFVGADGTGTVIANNILTGKSGSLITFAGTTPPVGFVLSSNIAKTGGAVLGVSGAAWTTGLADVDPSFVARGELSVLGPASTNAIGHADKGHAFVGIDFDGQSRDNEPDIGADELATTPIVRVPLTASDVGPDAP